MVLDSFNEWLRGLDFTMPDRMYDRKRNDGGMYLVSSEKIVSELMGMVDKQKYPWFSWTWRLRQGLHSVEGLPERLQEDRRRGI